MKVLTLKPLTLLLLVSWSWSCSSRNTVVAFVRRSSSIHHPCTTTALSSEHGRRGDNLSSCKQVDMPSLRVRGGGGIPSSKLSATIANEDDDEQSIKMAYQALQSIRYCCKTCFAAAIADIFTTITKGNIWFKIVDRDVFLSWVDYVDIFGKMTLLVFGGGLWRISHLYWKSFNDMNKRMSDDNLIQLLQTMAWMWGIISLQLSLMSVTIVVALPTHDSNGVFQFLWNMISPTQSSLVVVGIIAMNSIIILGRCKKKAVEEVRAYKEKHGIKEKQELKINVTMPKLDMVRTSGFRAYRNQALCAGSFAVVASLELTEWIVSFDGGIIGHVLLLRNILAHFAIGAFLFTLNRAMIPAVISEVMGNEKKVNNYNEQSYSDMFVAQARFYNKVAVTLKGVAISHVLPYIAAPAIPYILMALKGIPRFAKAIEAHGL